MEKNNWNIKCNEQITFNSVKFICKNLFSFVRNLYSREKKQFVINLEDEII